MNKQNKSNITPNIWSGGKTWTYYIAPPSATLEQRNFDIRISSASVETERSTFSNFTGFIRYFTVLTDAVELTINGTTQRVNYGKLIKFSGSDLVTCRGTTLDFNVIVREGINVEVFFASGQVVGPLLVFTEETLIELNQGDTLQLTQAICIKIASLD